MRGGLDPELAQRLVAQVGSSVAHNVNLMDADGLIVGSLDAARVGTVHEGAARAARSRSPVRVHAAEATELVRPGVNLPLVIDGEVLGVVGVTGEPDDVAELAELLLLALRLILDADQEHDARATRDGLARELVATLDAGQPDPLVFRARSAAAGAVLEAPFAVQVLVEPIALAGLPVASAGSPANPSEARGAAAAPAASGRLLRAARALPGTIAVVDHDGLWVLHGRLDLASTERLAHRAREAGAWVLSSGRLEDESALADAVRRCRSLLAVPALVPEGGAALDRLEVECVVASMDPGARRGLATRTVGGLGALETATVRALAYAGGSPTRAAGMLGLHRNSLTARIEALGRATGRDPRNPRELRRLELGLLAARADQH